MTEARAENSSFRSPVWLIVTCGCAIALLAFGPRSAMGFFVFPVLEDTGWSRSTFGLAMAIQNIMWGFGQPIFGALADRFGAWRMLAIGGITYSLGLYLMGTADAPIWLHIGGGALVGLGVAAGSFGIILSVFARNVPAEKRSFVFGLGTAAGSMGMFLFSPLTVALIESYGWSDTLIIFSILMLAIPVLAVPLFGNATSGTQDTSKIEQTVKQALTEALSHRSYILLVSGFFVCGFHVAFITVHLPPYISDIGIAAKYAGYAIGLIGLFNVIGSLGAGVLGQKYSKPMMLAWIYLLRSIAITVFLVLPKTPTSLMIFSMVMGLLWLSTVGPTNALVAVMFGTRHLGFLGGLVFLSHQIGSFLGVWLGGYMYDILGSYDTVWWLAVVLGLVAAILHWPIKEAAVPRLEVSR